MTIMPYELIQQLPHEIDPAAVVAHVYVGHAPGGGFGETHLLSHGGRLHVFGRGSMLGKFEPVNLVAGASPRLERGSFNSTLHVPTADGETRIVLSMFEVDQATSLVGEIHPEAIPPEPADPYASHAPDLREAPSAPRMQHPPKPPPPKSKPARQAQARPQPPSAPPVRQPQPSPAPPQHKSGQGHAPDPKAEIARYEKLLEQRPDDVVASLSLEEIYRDQGDYQNLARILLARVEHLDSSLEQVEALQEVADIYAVTGEPQNALECLQTAYLLDYTNPKTVQQLEQLVDEHNLWNKLLTGLNAEVQHLDEIAARAGILVQMSRWYRKIYSRPDYADACLMHAKRLDPQHPEVLAALNEPH